MIASRTLWFTAAATVLLSACGVGRSEEVPAAARAAEASGTVVTVRDTVVAAVIEASGSAAPITEAVLSTRLMATVLDVAVHEGDRVAAGQLLVRLDARDLEARGLQVQAGIAEAEAVRRDALTQAERIRSLYADSAAPRAQLDAVETGLSRAEAGVRTAHAAAAELAAVAGYAEIRAPFAGTVTRRFVDPGAMAAPGAPLVVVEDGSRLRLTVAAAPDAVRRLRRGDRLEATIEGIAATAVVEGVVPAAGGTTYEVNATVDNRGGHHLPRSAATLALPQGVRTTVLIPALATHREGDLTGVTVQAGEGTALRWVRLGDTRGDLVEVLSGLTAGERLVIPTGVER